MGCLKKTRMMSWVEIRFVGWCRADGQGWWKRVGGLGQIESCLVWLFEVGGQCLCGGSQESERLR